MIRNIRIETMDQLMELIGEKTYIFTEGSVILVLHSPPVL